MKRFTLGGEEIDPELEQEQEQESIKIANLLMLLSQGDGCGENGEASVTLPLSRVFECKTCNRRFSSFQALGGHRTSHKKPSILPDGQKSSEGSATKPKVHACSICGLQFPIGQALGGHMRRHRTMAPSLASGAVKQKPEGRTTMCFDLNLLPFENEIESSKIVFRTEIVDTIPVVECFH